jgi:dephospho-CoA kinase
MVKRRRDKKLILGLTGSFGSGKTTVAKIFASFGAELIGADAIAHEITRPGTPVYKRIVRVFGKDIIKKNRHIDRHKLAKAVFNNRNLLAKLNSITHPQIIRVIRNGLKHARSKIVVLDAPLLIEAGLGSLVDKIIVVKANSKEQIKRLLKKTALAKKDIIKRIKSQLSISHKVRLADFVIDNSGTIVETRRQVEQIRRQLWKN